MTSLTEQTARHIETRLEQGARSSTQAIAKDMGLDSGQLRGAFQEDLALTPRDYAAGLKAERLRLALRRDSDVTRAVYEAGYGSMSRVYEIADLELGMSPASYGLKGMGATIRYCLVDAPLQSAAGRFLLATTDRGICFTALGDADTPLEAQLRGAFANAESIARDDAALAPALADVITLIQPTYEQHHTVQLPLDIQSTAFQRRVWSGLLAIPAGETRGYQELARTLGNGRAQRAIARACASNPVALLIPCHRIVRSGGGLGGYRWGVAAKRALLSSEGALAGLQPGV